MSPGHFVDGLVEWLARLLTRLGLNGTRLRWKWQRYQAARAEAALQAEVRFRAVRGQYKMCPHCRSLIPSGAGTCAGCGQEVAHIQGPGPQRLLQWLFPGIQPATAALLTANLGLYLLMAMVGGLQSPSGGGLGALLSLGGFSRATLWRFGMGAGILILRGEIWRLVTPLFIHAGALHVLFNCYVLFQIGRLMEEEYGSQKVWVIYLFSGLCGGLSSNFLRYAILGQWVPYVGASGALLGLIGLAFVHGWRRGGPYGHRLRGAMGQWLVSLALLGLLVPGLDNFAHLGGLAGGVLLGLMVPPGRPSRPASVLAWRLGAWTGVALCVWAFLMAGLHGGDLLI
ncbi:MAG: rhomboid family intramembrane serine protease [Acidobacteriota bacterium]